MTTGVDTSAVVREVTIQARPETIFEFLVDPKKMMLWKGISADLDPKPGGVYSVDVTKEARARGEFREIVPNERVVISFGWEDSPIGPGSTTVEIELIPKGAATLVRLTHTGLPEEAREEHGKGWEHYLSRLAVAAPGGDPGPDPMIEATANRG